mmetsp:Transcript_18450/g.26024  ORF Transcript_18450/g.26024 Transcript_18450/m.26024 type:complete len:576 (-) Transcript_18450:108-1835(-)
MKVSKKGMLKDISTSASDNGSVGSGSTNSRSCMGRGGEKARKKGAGVTNSKTTKYQKAPNAPKRFKSAYMFFSTAKHKEIRSSLGTVRAATEKTTTIAKMVSKAWKELPGSQRATWEEMARLDKARYEAEKAEYKGPWKVPKPKRQHKDPNAPKRPMSAFIAYSVKKRSLVREEHPEASSAEIARILSNMWKAAPEDERQHYIDEEYRLRQEYKAEMKKWNEEDCPTNLIGVPVQDNQQLGQNFMNAQIAQDCPHQVQQQQQLQQQQLSGHNQGDMFNIPEMTQIPQPGTANLPILQMQMQNQIQPQQITAQDPNQQQPSSLLWSQSDTNIPPFAMMMHCNGMTPSMSPACQQQLGPNANGGTCAAAPRTAPGFSNYTFMPPAQQVVPCPQEQQLSMPTISVTSGMKQPNFTPNTSFSAQLALNNHNNGQNVFLPSLSKVEVSNALSQQQQNFNSLLASNNNTLGSYHLSKCENILLGMNTTISTPEAIGSNNNNAILDDHQQAPTDALCPSSLSVVESNNNMSNDGGAFHLTGESDAQSVSHSLSLFPDPIANDDFPIPSDDALCDDARFWAST